MSLREALELMSDHEGYELAIGELESQELAQEAAAIAADGMRATIGDMTSEIERLKIRIYELMTSGHDESGTDTDSQDNIISIEDIAKEIHNA